MKEIVVKKKSWDQPLVIKTQLDLAVGDVVIMESAEEIAVGIVQQTENIRSDASEKPETEYRISRKANLSDLKIINSHKKKADEALKICRDEAKKAELPMKIVDANFSFDGGIITFSFIADGRVDFRDLVKNLSKAMQRSVRLHQIGARDESRQAGGFGICGRELCCIKFSGNLPSITSDMAKMQQIAHRGSERISGLCGRLMCCLAYEAAEYRKMLEKYPKIGDEVQFNGAKAIVRDVNVLSEELRVELEDRSFISIKLNDLNA